MDPSTVESFGDEWSRYDQSQLSHSEARILFDKYFHIFPSSALTPTAVGFDMGCGTGRWAKYIAPNVRHLNCVDPSSAINIARETLSHLPNVSFFRESALSCSLKPCSQDFGYSLGVLHHTPDTFTSLCHCIQLLKPGAPFLLYLYYSFDNRPIWFRLVWQISNLIRKGICRLPPQLKSLVTDLIALFVYYPLSRISRLLASLGVSIDNIPLSFYKDSSFYTLKTDSRDRFGTPLELRFTKSEIEQMCLRAGLVNLTFSERAPFWVVVGYKSASQHS